MAQGLNSPLRIPIDRDPPAQIPREVRPYFEDVYASLYALQQAFIEYAGIAPADNDLWDKLRPQDTILNQNMNRLYVLAAEDIIAGGLINIFDSGSGAIGVRNANATNNTRVCHGYCSTEGGILTGDYGEVILGQGLLTQVSGLITGTNYFLATTNGFITATPPGAVGTIRQDVGIALANNLLYFNTAGFRQN